MSGREETITLGGGCFWCTEAVFNRVKGIQSVKSGYTGGELPNPTYEQVCTGRTGHAEAAQVVFDNEVIDFETLLHVFFATHDPTTLNRQGGDVGTQYRSGIFYHDEGQKRLAEASRLALQKNKPFRGEIVTEINPAAEFYAAEGYHQDYYQKNPARYKFYKSGCGREARLRELWGSRAN